MIGTRIEFRRYWDDERRTGVVVTEYPIQNSVGVVVDGATHEVVVHRDNIVGPVLHCDGCDQDWSDVKEYDVRVTGGEVMRTRYCGDCVLLAKANVTGDIEEVIDLAPSARD